ncbi:hypothetical protein MMC25_000721 [Agyrium rufum]|nr:hypothetical protein [Agyrium rufum]
MGYQRDPSHLASDSITILQAEYRRRVWLSVKNMDDMTSFLVGFPRMMPAIFSDTAEPRNLRDWELSDKTDILPASRPLTENTPATYLIVKGRLVQALSRVTDFINLPGSGSYDAVLEIDTSLHKAYQEFPPDMKMYSEKGEFMLPKRRSDASNLQLGAMYHLGMCTLHRRIMAKGRLDPRYSLSRDRCISSAWALLDFQLIIEPAWYQMSKTREMLGLAAMILFLELEHRRRDTMTDDHSEGDSLLIALKRSCVLWERARDSCHEAGRLHKILAGILASFQPAANNNASREEITETWDGFDVSSLPGHIGSGLLPTEPELFTLSEEMEIDWSTWDAFIEGSNFEEGTVY